MGETPVRSPTKNRISIFSFNPLIFMKPKSLDFITGLTFVPGWSLFGIIFILLGILRIIFGQHWEFGGFILLGIAMLISFDGVKFNFELGGVKSYTLIFGVFKIGKWVSLSKFPYLTVLRMSYRRTARLGALCPAQASQIREVPGVHPSSMKFTCSPKVT